MKAGFAKIVMSLFSLLFIGGIAAYGKIHGNADRYSIRGVTVVCRENTEEWCPSREEFSVFLDRVTCPYESVTDVTEALRGVRFVVVPEIMEHPRRVPQCEDTSDLYVVLNGRRYPCFNYGLTYPGDASYVFGPYATTMGTGGHELRLHILHYMFPNQPEADDIEFIRSLGECQGDTSPSPI